MKLIRAKKSEYIYRGKEISKEGKSFAELHRKHEIISPHRPIIVEIKITLQNCQMDITAAAPLNNPPDETHGPVSRSEGRLSGFCAGKCGNEC